MLDALKSKLGLRAAPIPPVNDLLDGIDTCREQIAVLKDDRRALLASPRPMAEVVEAFDRWSEGVVADSIDGLELAHLMQRVGRNGLRLSVTRDPAIEADRLLGLMLAANKAAIRKLILGELSQIAEAMPDALTDDQLAVRIEELDTAILSAELAEEAAIRALEKAGITVQRRAHAHPLAVLADDAALPG